MSYYEYNFWSDIAVLCFILFLCFLVMLIMMFLLGTKSRRYRRELVNMYVAAKVRVIAAKENIDISKEYELFKKWLKKQRLEDKDLDSAIEEELKEKIVEETKKKNE